MTTDEQAEGQYIERVLDEAAAQIAAPFHVTIDLETLGVGNAPVLLSLGAVKHTRTEILDRFHVRIDPASCPEPMKIDAGTVEWWLQDEQSQARQALLAHEKVDLASALVGFAQWLGDTPIGVWGNGATADNVWLRNAFAAAGLECPWPFWVDRCYRTMKNQVLVQVEREGTHHDALADAEYQARHLMAIWAKLDGDHYLLETSAKQFRFYEGQHRAKGTPEADEKAQVNADLAARIEHHLIGSPL